MASETPRPTGGAQRFSVLSSRSRGHPENTSKPSDDKSLYDPLSRPLWCSPAPKSREPSPPHHRCASSKTKMKPPTGGCSQAPHQDGTLPTLCPSSTCASPKVPGMLRPLNTPGWELRPARLPDFVLLPPAVLSPPAGSSTVSATTGRLAMEPTEPRFQDPSPAQAPSKPYIIMIHDFVLLFIKRPPQTVSMILTLQNLALPRPQ